MSSGSSINEIQRVIMEDRLFDARRALMVARTESVRTISEGTNNAYLSASTKGVEFEIEWVSSRDAAVRPAHQELDGETTDPGGVFEVDGDTAAGPGLFESAALSINCRCTTRPINVRG